MTMKSVTLTGLLKWRNCSPVNKKLFMENQNEKIKIINEKVSLSELKIIAVERFGDMVKAVVDTDKEIMAVGGEMHADEETELLKNGSKQESLWGINLYPDNLESDFVEFDSMINIRSRQNNRSRGVENAQIREKILEIVKKLIG